MRYTPFAILILCLVGLSASGQTDCGWNPDANGDNQVGVVDLLALLGVFEEQDSDDDGIWDSQDDCVGVEDPCGVCNGTGPDVPVIESIEVFYDSIYVEQIDDYVVFEVGADTTFNYVCPTPGCTDPDAGNFNSEAVVEDGSCVYGPEECGGATTVTFDGHAYDLVAIGSQCWFAENLRTVHYANGDAIPGNFNPSEWTSTSSGAQTVYGEGSSSCSSDCDEVANLEAYGRLYNWYAVDDSRGLCPSGWHVPTDGGWMTLEMELGMTSSEANSVGSRGTDQGAQLKSSPSDDPSWDGTNTSGFSALPGGFRDVSYYGSFSDEGSLGVWWTASPNGSSSAWYRALYSDDDGVYRNASNRRDGFSVRCLRDE